MVFYFILFIWQHAMIIISAFMPAELCSLFCDTSSAAKIILVISQVVNKVIKTEAYEGQKYWGGGAEYHVAVRSRQGGGCGKGDVLPPTQSTKKILLAYA